MMFRVVFWDILPCKMIVDRRFRGAYCLHLVLLVVDHSFELSALPISAVPSLYALLHSYPFTNHIIPDYFEFTAHCSV
jgi:hypothetical protein